MAGSRKRVPAPCGSLVAGDREAQASCMTGTPSPDQAGQDCGSMPEQVGQQPRLADVGPLRGGEQREGAVSGQGAQMLKAWGAFGLFELGPVARPNSSKRSGAWPYHVRSSVDGATACHHSSRRLFSLLSPGARSGRPVPGAIFPGRLVVGAADPHVTLARHDLPPPCQRSCTSSLPLSATLLLLRPAGRPPGIWPPGITFRRCHFRVDQLCIVLHHRFYQQDM